MKVADLLAVPGFEIFQMANIWLVMCAIALFQLRFQFGRAPGRPFNEGLPKTLQILSGIPALINLAAFMCDPDITITHVQSSANLAGLAIFNIGALLVLWSHLTLGRYWSGDLETQSDHRLIDTGPYAWVRHPLYSSYFLLSGGLFAMSGSWAVGLSLLCYFVAVAVRIPREEAMLAERLGESYRNYMSETGRLVPRLGKRNTRMFGPP